MLATLFLLELPLVSSNCVQCASPSLQNQWQLTGFPRRPDNLAFHPICASPAGTEALPLDSMTLKTCPTACFEMVIPSANQYHFVRGCHADFVVPNDLTQQIAANDSCTFSKVDDQLIYSDEGKTPLAAVVAAVRFVKINRESSDMLNQKISAKGLATDDMSKKMTDLKCIEATPVKCIKSLYYDGTGEDNNKISCSGAVCTSIVGKVNGKKYIERGCAPISPYTQSVCVTMGTESNFTAGPVDGVGAPPRKKRSLKIKLDATECFCTTEYCNTSTVQLRLPVVLVTVCIASFARWYY